MRQGYKKCAVYFLWVILGTGIFVFSQESDAPGDGESGGIKKSTEALAYQVGGGWTTIDFKGTPLMPEASGAAKIEAKPGYTNIDAKFMNLGQPAKFGAEFLTYVMWAVSTEGRTDNLGEVQINKNGDGKLKMRTQMQIFSLVLTAEPYFAVRTPSELVILENQRRADTIGRLFRIESYSLMERSRYQKLGNPLALSPDLKNVPLEIYQARNSVDIARNSGAEKYASDIFSKAEASLDVAEKALARKADKAYVISTARQTVQFSEDARTLSVQRREQESLESERKAAEEANLRAREQAELEKLRRAQSEAEKVQALLEQERSMRKAAEEAGLRAAAELERQQALAEQEKARKAEQEARIAAQESERAAREAERAAQEAALATREAERQRIAAEEEKAQLRARLLKQFSMVLETRDTERGLVVNMSDVLFDTGKYTLRQEAREKLARIAGILMNYPELRLEAEGHTDNVGSMELNEKLSRQRADSVRDYLISQGIPESSIASSGKGYSVPVASNDTSEGRQQNRRVELIVSGEVIGVKIGDL
jgi:outer membrane protein OmpA-like peptidoglycan-associated protein